MLRTGHSQVFVWWFHPTLRRPFAVAALTHWGMGRHLDGDHRNPTCNCTAPLRRSRCRKHFGELPRADADVYSLISQGSLLTPLVYRCSPTPVVIELGRWKEQY